MADQTRNITTGETDLTASIKSMVAQSHDGIIAISPAMAARILEEINYQGQRQIKMHRVEINIHQIKSGAWNPYLSVISIAVLPDGTMILVNGQHRLRAFIDLGLTVKTVVQLIPASSMDAVRQLYAGFDGQVSIRTENELIKAAGIDEKLKIKPKTAEILIKAVAVIENGMEPDIRGNDNMLFRDFGYRSEKAAAWEREARAFDALMELADPAMRPKLRRAGTMAVVLYTLRHRPEQAWEFWSSMVENDSLPKYDPRNTLYTDLITRKLGVGNRRQTVQQPALAWNAWYEGRKLKIIKCITGAGITLAGTPLAKGAAK